MDKLLFSKTHEWVKIKGGEAEIGISEYASHSLGDVVFVDLPAIGASFAAEAEFGAIESVKAASELMMPVAGKVIAINEALVDHPELINQDPMGTWLIKVLLTGPVDASKLLNEADYAHSHE
ncbi:MAG: glycine cleavage system protein GcvH [Bacilli bacterium]|jgi:glycine cleavage system H protein